MKFRIRYIPSEDVWIVERQCYIYEDYGFLKLGTRKVLKYRIVDNRGIPCFKKLMWPHTPFKHKKDALNFVEKCKNEKIVIDID